MKVMLLYPKWTTHYGISRYFAKRVSIQPPLNLTYLAAVAEQRNHEVRIIDGEAEDMPLPEMIAQTIAFNPDIIGITACTPFFYIAADLARGLKEANNKIPIAIGGPHITIVREKAFSPFFDYAFIGESEESLPEFLELFENRGDIPSVKGILLRGNGNIKFTGTREAMSDLDSLPLPARHLLKMEKYRMGTLQGVKNFAGIMFSRGCPFKCIYCCTDISGKKIRKRSPRSVVDEMISVISNFNVKHFYFHDDNLTLDRKYTLELCDLIIKEKLAITYEGSTRANLVDEEIISKMAESGLIRLSFGLETVDPEIRKNIKKEVPLESYQIANRIVNKYGIECLNSVMIGLPGETRETIKKTLSYLRHAREIKQANCSIAMPYPGTELFDMAKEGRMGLKLMTEDFSKYRRYGSAVMTVGELSPEDLIKLQNNAFVSIYSAPWRWRPMLKRMGFIGGVLTAFRLIKSLFNMASMR